MLRQLFILLAVPFSLAAADFKFEHHYIDRELPGKDYGLTDLVDVDHDGDLDFITGGKDQNKSIYWYEFQSPDKWVRHVLGTNHPSDVGGRALDVDGDGWIDFVAGGVWYRNTGKPRDEQFERLVFDKDLNAIHDLVIADVDGDGRPDVLTMSDKNNLRWYRVPKDGRALWERHDIGPGVHAGVAVGDLDGDGDLDVVRSNAWFENAGGKGTQWIEHPIPFGNPKQPYPNATRCVVVDINKDGRLDLVMTENEIRAGKIAWLENTGGKGLNWTVHPLSPTTGDKAARGAYHSLAVADFDKDGDMDIFTVEMEAIAGERTPRWFIWENVDGQSANFVERVILDKALGGHEAVVADVDGDGDLDICAKLWSPRKDNANGGRMHVDFLENLMITSFRAFDEPLDALKKRYGEAEANSYRPDLFPTSYDFRKGGIKLSVTPFANIAKKVDVFFDDAQADPVEKLLERYSGRTGWKQLPTTDSAFPKHFPLFSTEGGNSFYSCGSAMALVQHDMGLGKLVLWIQATDYPDLLAQYRKSKRKD